MPQGTERRPNGPVGCEAKSYTHNLRFQIWRPQKTEPGLLTPAPSTLTLLETDFEEGLSLA